MMGTAPAMMAGTAKGAAAAEGAAAKGAASDHVSDSSGGSGILVSVFIGIVVGAALVVGALKFDMVPPEQLALLELPQLQRAGSGTCPACPACAACPACPAAKDTGCQTQMAQLQAKLTEVQAQHAASSKALKDVDAEANKQRTAAAECQGRLQAAAVATKAPEAPAAKAPVAQAKKVSPAQVVGAVVDSAAVRACDAGLVNAACPDLRDAMGAWSYAIKTLKNTIAGTDNNFAQFIDQITGDVEYFLSAKDLPPNMVQEQYSISVANNRQVLEAARPTMGKKGEDEHISISDVPHLLAAGLA